METTRPSKAWDDISPRNAGKRKKIELCAARLEEKARGKGEPAKGLPRSIWKYAFPARERTPTEFFTESLILAQNERWRRV